MPRPPNPESRQHVLDAAEILFSRRGYAGVTLRDISSALGIHHASLYYYAPGGKEQLFIEVVERNFQRHSAGLTQAIQSAGSSIQAQLHAVADWLVSQPMLDMARMQETDMRAIAPSEAERLLVMGYNAIRLPIVGALEAAHLEGGIVIADFNLTAMGIVSLIESVHTIPEQYVGNQRAGIAHSLVDLFLNGLLKR
jgi:AcrR family transcriptional regulator